jgi:uncharacterized protein (TIGR03437 family)
MSERTSPILPVRLAPPHVMPAVNLAGVGVYQSNLLVPADLAAGDYDLVITVSGASGLPAKVSVGGK